LGIKCTQRSLQDSRWVIEFPIIGLRFVPFRDYSKKSLMRAITNTTYGEHDRRRIISIEPIDPQPVKCIGVDNESHTYLIGRTFVPTHNSTIACAFLLWYAMFHDNATILIVSNKNAGAMEMIDRITFMYESLPFWLKPGIDATSWNKHELRFDNGTKIVSQATTENSGRGLSITLLFADELGFVSPQIADRFWASISPTLSNGGRVIIASTPNGDSNLYAQLWRGAQLGTNGYHPTFVAWDRPPGRDQAFLDGERAKLGDLKVRQEYLCVRPNTIVTIKLPDGTVSDVTIEQLQGIMES
jgi:hypothetical protein